MNVKSLIAATAVATLPMMASAAIVPLTGTSTNANFDDIYTFNADSNSTFSHTFIVSTDGAGVAAISMDQLLSDYFSSITVSWNNGESVTGLDANGQAMVATTFGGSDTLVIEFAAGTDANVTYSGSVQISAVPVPAGLLLMGTAMAGLGVMRRKSKK